MKSEAELEQDAWEAIVELSHYTAPCNAIGHMTVACVTIPLPIGIVRGKDDRRGGVGGAGDPGAVHGKENQEHHEHQHNKGADVDGAAGILFL